MGERTDDLRLTQTFRQSRADRRQAAATVRAGERPVEEEGADRELENDVLRKITQTKW
jgi:hypothetical protein